MCVCVCVCVCGLCGRGPNVGILSQCCTSVEGLTDLIENKLPVQSDHSTAGDEAFVEERQRHRQLVLGGILKVKKRLAHLQDKALETKADPQGDDSEKVAFMSTKSELHSIYKKK